MKAQKQLFDLPDIFHDSYKISQSVSVKLTLNVWDGKWAPKPACGLDDVFPPDSIWFGSDAGCELCLIYM